MPVRLAIPAMGALHRGLDQAGPFAIAAARQVEPRMAGMEPDDGGRERRQLGGRAPEMARDRFTNERAELVFVHAP